MILQKVYYFQQMHAGSFNVKVLELYRKITSNKVFQRILLNMSFIDEVLQQPSYGWKNEKGDLVKPSLKQLYREAFSRINIFSTKKNWISLMSWVMTICLLPFFFLFIFKFFSFKLLLVFIVYSMIVLSTHGTIWFHRFCTHKAYTFSHSIWRFIVQNLVIK